ncbi:MAG: hypothetical protein HDQ99_05705 [Lachnospiraceae bacterium]|nr:hypothetical protein [Lachnospiraceae bacterium]
MEKQYLSLEEQFKKTLNNMEITRIEDYELREIRQSHWNYRHKIFLDEHRISDQELCRLTDIDYVREHKELEEYCKLKGISTDIIWNC